MGSKEYLREVAERIEKQTRVCDELTEDDIWGSHGDLVWRARRFSGTPHFYPVYRHGEYYSYSLLALIVRKGELRLNQQVRRVADSPGYLCHSGTETIDREIERIGAAHPCAFGIQDVSTYAKHLADALVSDAAAVESRNENKTNIILCGGKDSLNLLLLPLKNPTVAVSAEPNYPYVCRFVEENGLSNEVIRLEDRMDKDSLDAEALEACCRMDLRHWRWVTHLKELAERYEKKVVFWKGQVADLYTTDKWKIFVHPPRKPELVARKVWKRMRPVLPNRVNHTLGRWLQPRVVKATWERCATMQGAHMGFIRMLTDSLAISAYHGPETIAVFANTDLGAVAQVDMRDEVGYRLLGKRVRYPKENPSPPDSSFRVGLGRPDHFLRLLRNGEIRVS